MRVHLDANTKAAARARAAATAFLAPSVTPPHLNRDDALLTVSELVTNALNAGARRITLELTLASDTFTILVEDDALGWPAVQHPPEDSETGRGLSIVDTLADRWEVLPSGTGKKVVAVFRTKG